MQYAKNLSEFGLKIRNHRQNRGLTQDQLASATGISKPYISNIETGRIVGPPTSEKLRKLEDALGLEENELCRQADWLKVPETLRDRLAGDSDDIHFGCPAGPPSTPDHDTATSYDSGQLVHYTGELPERFTPVPLKKVPLINRVAAGTPIEATDLDYPVNIADRDALIPNELVDGCFALRIDGDSMTPVYQPGDIVIFSGDRTPVDGDDCLVRLGDADNFSTTFKRIHFVDASGVKNKDGEFVFLEPLNSDYAPRIVRRVDLTGLYPALWKVSAVCRSV
ncbi:MAG: helix-turn-helix domain-containing protein [Phycisphaerae bacterium]